MSALGLEGFLSSFVGSSNFHPDEDLAGCDNALSITLSDCQSDPSYLTGDLAEVCDDTIDNDGDRDTDCDDSECATSTECGGCALDDLGSDVSSSVATDNLTFLDAAMLSCGDGGTAASTGYSWTAPFDGDFVFSTEGSVDGAAIALYSDCSGTEIACDRDGLDSNVFP